MEDEREVRTCGTKHDLQRTNLAWDFQGCDRLLLSVCR